MRYPWLANVGVLIEVDVGPSSYGCYYFDTRQIALMVNQVAENPKLLFADLLPMLAIYSLTGDKYVLAIHNLHATG